MYCGLPFFFLEVVLLVSFFDHANGLDIHNFVLRIGLADDEIKRQQLKNLLIAVHVYRYSNLPEEVKSCMLLRCSIIFFVFFENRLPFVQYSGVIFISVPFIALTTKIALDQNKIVMSIVIASI